MSKRAADTAIDTRDRKRRNTRAQHFRRAFLPNPKHYDVLEIEKLWSTTSGKLLWYTRECSKQGKERSALENQVQRLEALCEELRQGKQMSKDDLERVLAKFAEDEEEDKDFSKFFGCK